MNTKCDDTSTAFGFANKLSQIRYSCATDREYHRELNQYLTSHISFCTWWRQNCRVPLCVVNSVVASPV